MHEAWQCVRLPADHHFYSYPTAAAAPSGGRQQGLTAASLSLKSPLFISSYPAVEVTSNAAQAIGSRGILLIRHGPPALRFPTLDKVRVRNFPFPFSSFLFNLLEKIQNQSFLFTLAFT
jgi:hypothetical protein